MRFGAKAFLIIAAEKTRCRTQTGGLWAKPSTWCLWVRNPSGQVEKIMATAEHHSARTASTSLFEEWAGQEVDDRNDRYDYAGGDAVVKRLDHRHPYLFNVVLKSFHSSKQARVDIFLLRDYARLLYAQGFSAIAGTRPSARFPRDGKAFLVMQRIPGRDLESLLECHGFMGQLGSKLSTPLAQQGVLLSVMDLIAFVTFFHRIHQRPIIDIKPGNIMLDVGTDVSGFSDLRFTVIDLDGSLARRVNRTNSHLPNRCRKPIQTKPLDEIQHFDGLILAIALARFFSALYPGAFVNLSRSSDEYSTFRLDFTVSQLQTAIGQLLSRLNNQKPQQTLVDAVREALNRMPDLQQACLLRIERRVAEFEQRYAAYDSDVLAANKMPSKPDVENGEVAAPSADEKPKSKSNCCSCLARLLTCRSKGNSKAQDSFEEEISASRYHTMDSQNN